MTGEEVETIVRAILTETLALPAERVARFDAGTRLFGALPEFDSMAVAGLLMELEDRLHIRIEDDEIGGDLFATFGALLGYARRKAAG